MNDEAGAAINLAFTYTRAEYLRAARHYLFAAKTITVRSIVLVGLLLAFAVVYGLYDGFKAGSVTILVLGAVVTALGLILYFYIPARVWRKTEKYQNEYHLGFSPEGIHFVTKGIDSRLGWETYARFWESAEFFYLVSGAQQYTIVPKRVFAGEEQTEAFRQLAAAKVGPAEAV